MMLHISSRSSTDNCSGISQTRVMGKLEQRRGAGDTRSVRLERNQGVNVVCKTRKTG